MEWGIEIHFAGYHARYCFERVAIEIPPPPPPCKSSPRNEKVTTYNTKPDMLLISKWDCYLRNPSSKLLFLTKAHPGAKSKRLRGERMIMGLARVIPQPPVRFVLQRIIKQCWITTHCIQWNTYHRLFFTQNKIEDWANQRPHRSGKQDNLRPPRHFNDPAYQL